MEEFFSEIEKAKGKRMSWSDCKTIIIVVLIGTVFAIGNSSANRQKEVVRLNSELLKTEELLQEERSEKPIVEPKPDKQVEVLEEIRDLLKEKQND